MNFFRSEEHLRRWKGFSNKKEGGIITPKDVMQLFSGQYFTKRREPDYFSHMGEYLADMIAALDSLDSAGSFWRLRRIEKLGLSLAQRLGLL